MQHVEEAGIHSGDSACVLPPHSLGAEMLDRVHVAVAPGCAVRVVVVLTLCACNAATPSAGKNSATQSARTN